MPKKASLQETHPELAAEWHPVKNGDLAPMDVTAGSDKKVWWLKQYDDPVTGLHFDFEWVAAIKDRKNGEGCPFLCGRAVCPGFNDLATLRPDLAKEWHPTKNGNLTPQQVTSGCKSVVWWLVQFEDPRTGKHFDFEWPASILSRSKGRGCPFLSGRAVWPGFNDLATLRPDLAKEWHPTKNGNLTPQQVTVGSGTKVWWSFPYDDPSSGKHFAFEWQAVIKNRCKGADCPFLSGHAVWPGFNDLATLRPDLAKEWHPTKNGNLTPQQVFAGKDAKAWWILPYDDPDTGKHLDFEWQASIKSRFYGKNCPYLSGKAVWPGYNDLATCRPELAREWHPTRNRKLSPERVTVGTESKVWWLCDTCGHAWRMSILTRTSLGSGCPKCGGHRTGK